MPQHSREWKSAVRNWKQPQRPALTRLVVPREKGKEGLIRDIPRWLDRGFPSAARLRASMIFNDDTAPDAFAVAKASMLSIPDGLSISFLKMLYTIRQQPVVEVRRDTRQGFAAAARRAKEDDAGHHRRRTTTPGGARLCRVKGWERGGPGSFVVTRLG